MANDSNYPRFICEECTTELVMVAKFHEKCELSMVALNKLTKQISKAKNVFIKTSKTPNNAVAEQVTIIENKPNDIKSSSVDSEDVIEYQLKDVQDNVEFQLESQEYSTDSYAENNFEYVIFDETEDVIEESELVNEIEIQQDSEQTVISYFSIFKKIDDVFII